MTGVGKERDMTISVIRVVSMFMIVVCHIFLALDNELAWWFNVGVYTFIFISGFLFGQKPMGAVITWFKRRVRKIIVPYYIFVLSFLLLVFIARRDLFITPHVIANLLMLNFILPGIGGLGHLWFVPVIIICYLTTPFLDRVRSGQGPVDRRSMFMGLIALLVIAQLATVLTVGIGLVILSCVLSYTLGYSISTIHLDPDIDDDERYRGMGRVVMFIVILAVVLNAIKIVVNYIIRPDLTGVAADLHLLLDTDAHVLLGAAIFLGSNQLLAGRLELKEGLALSTIQYLDGRSYEIYIVHHVLIIGSFSLMALTGFVMVNVSIILALVMILAVALNWATGKAMPFVDAIVKP